VRISKNVTGRPRRGVGRVTPWRSVVLFLTPFLLLFVVFQVWPLAVAVRNSTLDYNLLRPNSATDVGFDNYIRAISDPAFLNSIWVTTVFTVAQVLIGVPAALGLAMLVQRQFRGRYGVRTAAFSPTVTSTVVISVLWLMMFNPTYGLLNSILRFFGLPGFEYTLNESQALPSLVIMSVWQQVGFAMILYLGGLQGIPAVLEEAAAVDGANARQRFWFVTRPLLNRTTLLVVVVMTIFSYQTFTPAFVMTKGGPNGVTDFVVYLIYRVAIIGSDMGYASTLSVILVAFLLGLSFIQFRFLRARWEY
jgi:multiple sugar transport system permease protein